MKVPFLDLSGITQEIKKEYLKRIEKFLDEGVFMLNHDVENFEKSWAKMIGTSYCLGVSNGADAIYLALTALGIGKNDEVITQGNAYNASVTAILRCGATPRFVDINPEDFSLDPKQVEKQINKKTKAILVVHLYGCPANMQLISKIAKKHKLKLIEDCAQAHLAEYKGQKVGSWGDVGAFSFYPTKNLGAFGDAGAITTNDPKIYKTILSLRNLGQKEKNNHTLLGYNMRLDAMQAIALELKLKYLQKNTATRIKSAKYYDSIIKKTKIPASIITSDEAKLNVYHLYPIVLEKGSRKELMKYLGAKGITSIIHYPELVYKQAFYDLPYQKCPISEKISEQILSLPFYVGISKKEQDAVIRTIKNFYEQK